MGSTKQTTATTTSTREEYSEEMGKMMESMRKSTENLSGLLEPSVTTSPTGDPLAADVGDSGTCLPFFPSILSSDVSAGKDGNYQLKKKRSTLSFFKGKS